MNLSVLHHPEITGQFSKNPYYNELEGLNQSEIAPIIAIGKTPLFIDLALKFQYIKRGSQVRISKEVSDNLIDSKFESGITFDDINWPTRVMELYFDDPIIPTIIIAKMPFKTFIETFSKEYHFSPKSYPASTVSPDGTVYDRDVNQESFFAAINFNDGQSSVISLSKQTWDAFLHGELENPLPGSIPLDEQEEKVGIAMTALAMRVLAFASIPQAIGDSLTRKTMKGGKPKVHGRPNRPNIRIIYLPHVYFEQTKRYQSKGDHTIEYREGHFRFFRHERFTNMRGKFIWVKPFGEKSKIKTQYRVRNVKRK